MPTFRAFRYFTLLTRCLITARGTAKDPQCSSQQCTDSVEVLQHDVGVQHISAWASHGREMLPFAHASCEDRFKGSLAGRCFAGQRLYRKQDVLEMVEGNSSKTGILERLTADHVEMKVKMILATVPFDNRSLAVEFRFEVKPVIEVFCTDAQLSTAPVCDARGQLVAIRLYALGCVALRSEPNFRADIGADGTIKIPISIDGKLMIDWSSVCKNLPNLEQVQCS